MYWVVDFTYTDSNFPLSSVWSSPTELKRGLKGPRLISRKGLYNFHHHRHWTLNFRYINLLQIKPDVSLLAAVEPAPLEGVGRQVPDKSILFLSLPRRKSRIHPLSSGNSMLPSLLLRTMGGYLPPPRRCPRISSIKYGFHRCHRSNIDYG